MVQTCPSRPFLFMQEGHTINGIFVILTFSFFFLLLNFHFYTIIKNLFKVVSEQGLDTDGCKLEMVQTLVLLESHCSIIISPLTASSTLGQPMLLPQTTFSKQYQHGGQHHSTIFTKLQSYNSSKRQFTTLDVSQELKHPIFQYWSPSPRFIISNLPHFDDTEGQQIYWLQQLR